MTPGQPWAGIFVDGDISRMIRNLTNRIIIILVVLLLALWIDLAPKI
jgi:hypothetical protein